MIEIAKKLFLGIQDIAVKCFHEYLSVQLFFLLHGSAVSGCGSRVVNILCTIENSVGDSVL